VPPAGETVVATPEPDEYPDPYSSVASSNVATEFIPVAPVTVISILLPG
jgi:hypothetical protein